jgi:GNAT superfamily N-acetyltransferase
MEILIRPLSKDLLGDFFSFFEGVHFEENPHWSACYCYSFHFTGTSEQWTGSSNKTCVEKLVDEDRMKGYLAYFEGRPVGWCNANNRLNFQRLGKIYDLTDAGHPATCSIVCFLIHPDYKRKGIARQFLHRIISDYSALDYERIEAYPGKGERSSERHYTGPLELYLENGFQVVRELNEHHVVRKIL